LKYYFRCVLTDMSTFQQKKMKSSPLDKRCKCLTFHRHCKFVI
jgi:hypothetical protein